MRILVVTQQMDFGATETHIIRVFREVCSSGIKFDFFLSNAYNYHYKEIIQLGGNVYICPDCSEEREMKLKSILCQHLHSGIIKITDGSKNDWKDLLLANKFELKQIILMLNNSVIDFVQSILPSIHNLFILYDSRHIALKWIYQYRVVKVIYGIQPQRYSFNYNMRNEERNQWGISDQFIVGNVGRFYANKNHFFLIDVFAEFVKYRPNSKLMLVGDGELKNEIKKQVDSYNISEKIIFAGMSDSIARSLMAMDVFCLPSFEENTINSILEAQTSGLQCLSSDTISEKLNITGHVYYLPINDCSIWVDQMENLYHSYREIKRQQASLAVENTEYDIRRWVKNIIQLLFTE